MEKKRKRISQCPNCQTMLSARDNFCPNCGQENHYNNHSIKELLNDFFASFINFDNKIWNSLKTILLQPGQITKQYVEGKRIRFVPPFKLYLFFSFIFFVMMSFSFQKASHSDFSRKILNRINQVIASETLNISEKEYNRLKNANSDVIKSFIDSVFAYKTKWNRTKKEDFYNLVNKNVLSDFRVGISENNFSIGTQKSFLSYDIFLEKKPQFDTILILNHQITRKELKLVYDDKTKLDSLVTTKWKKLGYFKQIELKNLIHKTGVFSFGNVTQMTEFVDKEINKYLSIASYTIILMMPFVSLLLLIFFRKKHKKLYVHLIHSLHLHSTIYLFTSILMGIFLITGLNALFLGVYILFVIGLVVYFIISNRVLYQERKSITVLKSIFLIALYFIISLLVAFYIGLISVAYI
ncbi:DUF3667 domain-containing protein [Capnocytophaga canimorsus]|uniref:DUF3667 domain-containing protein n=1 Tax=Capnocytophaga canimorsus TaxID=28188 RepID=UPI000D6DD040|nr:DUF3667 domain-containing protein [Capnocytophaga canimorsus]AWL79062.1 hypothetical protein DKB58_09005 [Capnocytophaga canimorsus]AYW37658.1 DUF3667 domain-containing protein [Capnocytophaga canimorsus]MDT9499066.1 DUF3667 domain-containing protein [Capnocytophaga canimorsus]